MTDHVPSEEPLKVLALSSIFPNHVQPAHGIFIAHRLTHLAARDDMALRVIAPVPWFPSTSGLFGRYASFARVPRQEAEPRFPVLHPRYGVVPKIGMVMTPYLMAAAVAPALAKLLSGDFNFNVIDAYYLYPDGVAAALLSSWFHRPLVLTALGSDVSLISHAAVPRRQIKWAMGRANGMTAVCRALSDEMEAMGVPAGGVQVVYHGVDLDLFRPPADRDAARKALGIEGPTLLSAGSLIPRKGHHIVIGALPSLPTVKLMIAGAGSMERELREQAAELGVAERVNFLGEVTQERLRDIMGAVDALVLCSDREGIANVLMESLACGTPVIATPIWGTPEIITSPDIGILLTDRSPQALAVAVRNFLAYPLDRAAARRHAEKFSWSTTAAQHAATLRAAVRNYRSGA